MAETGQIRIVRNPKRDTHLQLTSKVTLITPTSTPANTYYETTLCRAPLSALLDQSLSAEGLVGHTQPCASEISATITPHNLHVSLSTPEFHKLGLESRRATRARKQDDAFRMVTIPRPAFGRALERSRWALAHDRVGVFDIVLSAGTTRVNIPAGLHASTRTLRTRQWTQESLWFDGVAFADVDDEEIVRRGDDAQHLAQGRNGWRTGRPRERNQGEDEYKHEHEHEEMGTMRTVHVREYVGLGNQEVIHDCVRVARAAAKDAGMAAVVTRAARTPVMWTDGACNAGFVRGFGGDAAEVFLARPGGCVVLQLRAGADVA